MSSNHDWQSLVELSGLLVSEPVLNENFPDGPQPLPVWLSRRFRSEYERWQGAEDRREKNAEAADRARTRWIEFALTRLLDYDESRLWSSMSLPPQLVIDLTDYMQTLKPNMALVDDKGNPQLLVYVANGALDRPEQVTGRWKASPFTKIDRLLRDTRVHLGILTNGTDWRLIYAAPGLPTSYITWTANGWNDERTTLQAFVMLLRSPARLIDMAAESQQRQADVTDQLGNQVLSALSIFVRELDRLDTEHNGALLNGMSPEEVYETALFLMMRLVFIFYAEENHLLPHGDVFYDQAYGLTHLWNRLEQERMVDFDRFQYLEDAWPGLLASFRLIHRGCSHPDFAMVAYGGALFAPERFTILEDSRLRVKNEALWKILRRLTTAESKDGRQRVSYRALQVEQLGYVYENLLGYTVREAKEPMLLPAGGLEAFPVQTFIDALENDSLYDYYKTVTNLHWAQAKSRAEDVTTRAGESDEIAWVFDPIADEFIDPGQRYVAFQMGTRKRGGIFYTPPQLTSFLVEQALKPQCYDDHESETPRIKTPQHILSLTVCDPAMGSGAFLVQAVRYLADRLLEAWDANTAEANGTTLHMPYAQPINKSSEDYGPIPTDRAEALAWARRLVAERCIYGVDLNHLAVELAKLSLWLVTLGKDKPFTFLDHRLRHGNSLIGASFFAETTIEIKKRRKGDVKAVGTERAVRQISFIPDEALKAHKGASKALKSTIQDRIKGNRSAIESIASRQISLFADMTIEETLRRLVEQKRRFATPTRKATDYDSKVHLLKQVVEQGDYPKLKEIADLWCAVWFWPRLQVDNQSEGNLPSPSGGGAGGEGSEGLNLPPTTQEYHDTVYAILGLPAIITTTDQRIAQIRRVAKDVARREHFFHWELEFPAIFTRSNPGFDALCGNPPWDIVQEEDVDSTILESLKEWFKFGDYDILSGRRDLYKLFTVLGMRLVARRANLSFVVPFGMFVEDDSSDLRHELYKKRGAIRNLVHFQNNRKLFFGEVDSRYRFVVFNHLHLDTVSHRYSTVIHHPEEIHNSTSISIALDDLQLEMGDDFGAILFDSKAYHSVHSRILASLRQMPILDYEVIAEFHASSDKELRIPKPIDGDWQTLKNKSIHHFDHLFGEGNWYLTEEAVAERCKRKELDASIWTGTNPRLLFRDIARNDDSRTLICCLAPRGFVSTYDTPMVVPNVPTKELQETLVYMMGVMASFVADFILRPYVDKHIKGYILKRLPIPRLQAVNPYFEALVPRAARLTCFTEEFADLWEEVMGTPWPDDPLVCPPPRSGNAAIEAIRQRLRDEIDALVAHLYGLSRDDFEHILGTFPLVFRDDDAGRAKKDALLLVYDEYEAITRDWSRD